MESDYNCFCVEVVGCGSVDPSHHSTRPSCICSVQTMEIVIQRMIARSATSGPTQQRSDRQIGNRGGTGTQPQVGGAPDNSTLGECQVRFSPRPEGGRSGRLPAAKRMRHPVPANRCFVERSTGLPGKAGPKAELP